LKGLGFVVFGSVKNFIKLKDPWCALRKTL